jgi:hypothetical protein
VGSVIPAGSGQVAYHLLAQAGTARAPWGITTAVSCLPVLVLGMGAALAHLLRADTQAAGQAGQGGLACPDQAAARADQGGQGQAAGTASLGRLAEAQEAAVRLAAAGHRVSRRTLRTAGLHGSNADLGALARITRSQLATARAGTGQA